MTKQLTELYNRYAGEFEPLLEQQERIEDELSELYGKNNETDEGISTGKGLANLFKRKEDITGQIEKKRKTLATVNSRLDAMKDAYHKDIIREVNNARQSDIEALNAERFEPVHAEYIEIRNQLADKVRELEAIKEGIDKETQEGRNQFTKYLPKSERYLITTNYGVDPLMAHVRSDINEVNFDSIKRQSIWND